MTAIFKRVLMTLMVLSTTALWISCETHPEPQPTPEAEEFDILIHNVSRGTVWLSVTPANLDMDYLCVVYEKEEADKFMREKFLIEAIFQEITEEAYSQGKTFAEYMPEVIDRGKIENITFSGLDNDTDYYILVFGVDASNDFKAITAITKKEFKTVNIPHLVCDFRVGHSVENNTVCLNVDPTDEDIKWYLCTMPVEQYNYYVEDENGYQMSQSYFYEYYFQQDINTLLGQGMSQEQVIEALIHEGALTLEASGLKEYTDYYFLIAGLIMDHDGIFICTDVQRGMYTTEGAAQSEMTFEIEVWDIEQMAASFSITPSNNSDKYCALVAPWDGVSTADEVMHQIVDQWGGWMDVMANDRGRVEHSGANKFKLPAADTDYYIIAFGYDGGITTAACMETFRTQPGGSIEEVTFTIETKNHSPYGFTMDVKSSDETIYYIPGVCASDSYDEATFVGYESEAFAYYLEEYKKFNPAITIAEILDQYYYNGNNSLMVSGLTPDTDYMGYVFALDVHTGEIIRTFTFDNIAHTQPLGSAMPTIEVVGYYSGDDEAGTIWNQPSVTAGKAITVVKYSNLDNVRSLFTAMVSDDVTNSYTYPDSELWSLTSGLWAKCALATPYSFYTAEWNVVQTALAYATDNEGIIGSIARQYTCPTADQKGDVEELRALVAELNQATRTSVSMPASVVVDQHSNTGNPTISRIE